MSRRIEIELTSARDDATFTWRAAGARQPKGVVPAATLPSDAKVGDVLRVELDIGLDGTQITQVIADRAPRVEAERLEVVGHPIADDALVTSQLAARGGNRKRRGDKNRPDRGDRDRPRRDARGDTKPRTPGEQSARRSRTDQATRDRPPKRTAPPKIRAPRLRSRQEHRNAFLATLAEEQQAVAAKLTHGGLAGLRKAIEDDNAKRKAQGQPELPAEGLIQIAEQILPRLQEAEWHDRADAALEQVGTVDLRDLRSVVVASDDYARTEVTRTLAGELRERLAARVEQAQTEWLNELETGLAEKRLARVINLSSRPPKAGSPLPQALADKLVEATNEALSPESASGRWVALLDALAFAPFRQRVVPKGVPSEPSDELRAKVTKLAPQLPAVAAAFGVSVGDNSTR